MRDIEGIDKILQSLEPHWDKINAHFNQENELFKNLMARNHDLLGRVLKCHLVIEHYLDRFLIEKMHLDNVEEANLSFFQKVKLLPDEGTAASFVEPGIIKLNKIRNNYGHQLDVSLDLCELGPINEVLKVARRGVQFSSAIECIEAFTTIACTWLIIPPPGLEQVFLEAFSEVRVKPV